MTPQNQTTSMGSRADRRRTLAPNNKLIVPIGAQPTRRTTACAARAPPVTGTPSTEPERGPRAPRDADGRGVCRTPAEPDSECDLEVSLPSAAANRHAALANWSLTACCQTWA